MTVTHAVLLKFKENVTPQQVDDFFVRLYALRKDIRGLLCFKSGVYQSQENLNQGFTHAFVMEFDNENSRNVYLAHPEHQALASEIVDTLQEGITGVIAFDFVQGEHPLTPRTVIDVAQQLLTDDGSDINLLEWTACHDNLQVLYDNLTHNPAYGIRLVGNRPPIPLPFDLSTVSDYLDQVKERLAALPTLAHQ